MADIMDELMLMEYLKNKGMEDMSEQEFIHKFKEFMRKHGKTSYMRYHEDMDDYYPEYDMQYRKMGSMRNNQDYYSDYPYSEYPEFHMTEVHSRRGQKSPMRGFNRMQDEMNEYPMDMMRNVSNFTGSHFNESYAKYVVSTMYHTENGRKHTGEKFNMAKAKEIQERYRGIITHDITVADIYVAINAQYHDYCELFKSWFGSNIEQKIIESAIVFWFKDSDYTKGFKLMDYFKED